jgi:hypothetical protein
VYALNGAAPSIEFELWAACLAVEALVSHRSAAALLGFPIEHPSHKPEISLIRTANARLDGVIVHRPCDLELARRHRAKGFSVTDAHRTALDLGAVVRSWSTYETALDWALRNRRVTVDGLWFTLNQHARPGRAGTRRLRRYLSDPSITLPTPGVLEARLARFLTEIDVADRFDVEHRITTDGLFLGRVDAASPAVRVVIEVDGWEVHGSPSALRYDLKRQNQIVLDGWTVLRYTWLDLVTDRARMRREILQALEP